MGFWLLPYLFLYICLLTAGGFTDERMCRCLSCAHYMDAKLLKKIRKEGFTYIKQGQEDDFFASKHQNVTSIFLFPFFESKVHLELEHGCDDEMTGDIFRDNADHEVHDIADGRYDGRIQKFQQGMSR